MLLDFHAKLKNHLLRQMYFFLYFTIYFYFTLFLLFLRNADLELTTKHKSLRNVKFWLEWFVYRLTYRTYLTMRKQQIAVIKYSEAMYYSIRGSRVHRSWNHSLLSSWMSAGNANTRYLADRRSKCQ